MESNTNECTIVHVQSPYVSQIFYCVDLGAAIQVFWTQFALYLLETRNGCFTIFITLTSYSSSVQAYTFQKIVHRGEIPPRLKNVSKIPHEMKDVTEGAPDGFEPETP